MNDEKLKPCDFYCGDNHKGKHDLGICSICWYSICEVCGIKDATVHKQSVNENGFTDCAEE